MISQKEHNRRSRQARKRYRQTAKGKAAEKRAWQKKRRTPEGRAAFTAAMGRYRQTAKGRAAKQRYREKYPERLRARRALGYAIERGYLVRPDQCSRCGSVGKVEAHHHNGYEPEHYLDVLWLCRPCHRSNHESSV